jgi:hypothetical protein
MIKKKNYLVLLMILYKIVILILSLTNKKIYKLQINFNIKININKILKLTIVIINNLKHLIIFLILPIYQNKN